MLVACDFDGTLAPFVPEPGEARLPPTAREALSKLVQSPGVRVAVVSSRALRDLAQRVHVRGVWLAGSGGLETRVPGGGTRRRTARPVPDPLRRSLRDWCVRHPGAWLEMKPLGLAIHHRGLPRNRRAAFVAGVRRRAVPFAPAFRVIAAARACELVPATGRDKATVLAEWSRGLPRGAVLWLGDDAPDEPAHAWVRHHGGVAVVVGRRRSVAPHRVRSPREVTRLLVRLARAIDRERERGCSGPARRVTADDRAPLRRRDRAMRRRRPSRRA
jgi:trehalose-phosphatase